MITRFMHCETGMTGRMGFEDRGHEAAIWIEHIGERAETIIDHPETIAAARAACENFDIGTYIEIWKMGLAFFERVERQEAA